MDEHFGDINIPLDGELKEVGPWQGLHTLDDWLQHGAPVRALYLRAPRASGKSTSLLLHVLGRMLRSRAQARVIYVTSTRAEANLLLKLLMAGDAEVEQDFRELRKKELGENDIHTLLVQEDLMVWSYAGIVAIAARGRIPRDVCLMVDIDVVSDTLSEHLFSVLLDLRHDSDQLVQEDVNTDEDEDDQFTDIAVMILAPFICERTTEAFQRFYTHPRSFEIFDSDLPKPEIEIETIPAGDTDAVVARIVEVREDKGRSLICGAIEDCKIIVKNVGGLEPVACENGDGRKAISEIIPRHDLSAAVCHGAVPFSTSIPGLQLVFSTESRRQELFDPFSGLVTWKSRPLSRAELDLNHSWAWKAPIRIPRILATYDAKEYETRPADAGSFGIAWNRDITIHMLMTIYRLGRRYQISDYPIRLYTDYDAYADTVHRLRTLDCTMEAEKEGYYHTTNRGDLIAKLYLRTNRVCRFEVLYFLSMALDIDPARRRLRRVMMYIAGILQVGHDKLYSVTKDDALPRDIEAECAEEVRSRATFGAVWASLGIWLQLQSEGHEMVLEGGALKLRRGPFEISLEVAEIITMWCHDIGCPILGTEMKDPNDKPLDAEDLAVIDCALFRSFFHKLALVPPTVEPVTHIATGVELLVAESVEVLKLRDMVDATRHLSAVGGFYVICERFVQYMEEQLAGNANAPWVSYWAMGLTALPVADYIETEGSREVMVGSTYPLRAPS